VIQTPPYGIATSLLRRGEGHLGPH
jgi:hypothetical protein